MGRAEKRLLSQCCDRSTADSIRNGKESDCAAGDEAGDHTDDEGKVVLIETVDDGDGLKHIEAGKRDQRDAVIGFLAPQGDRLWDEEGGVSEEAQAKYDRYDLFHVV